MAKGHARHALDEQQPLRAELVQVRAERLRARAPVGPGLAAAPRPLAALPTAFEATCAYYQPGSSSSGAYVPAYMALLDGTCYYPTAETAGMYDCGAAGGLRVSAVAPRRSAS